MIELPTKPLSPVLGVEVLHDLAADMSDAVMEAVEALYLRHHLLLFRRQRLDAEQQVRFATHFGPISRRSPAMRDKDTVMVSNRAEGGVLGDGELLFHSDNTFFREPLKAIGLFAIEVPGEGGDTLFANCEMIYEALPEAVKDRIADLSSYQVFDYEGDYNRRPDLSRIPATAQRAMHPLVWRNPANGRSVLFFSEHTTAYIEGLERAEEEDLIATLREAIADPRFGYRHRWQPGDFLFWDNVVLQHARTDFDRSQPRTLRRTPVLDPDGAARFPKSRDMLLAAAS